MILNIWTGSIGQSRDGLERPDHGHGFFNLKRQPHVSPQGLMII